jgi:hypothetical protein
MSLDFSQFASFYKNMVGVQQDLESWLVAFLNRESARAYREIKQRTPVDTGLLRGNWGASPVTVVSGSSIVAIFTNPTEYALWVEEGHHLRNGAWWEGYHFTRIPLDKVRQALPARFARDFSSWLRSRGIGG